MWPWYLLKLTYRAVGLALSVAAVIPYFQAVFWHLEGSAFFCSSISTARQNWGTCITARGGSAMWQFTLFSCYYDGNAALFTTAHAPKREPSTNNRAHSSEENMRAACSHWQASVIIQISVLFHQETLMHSAYCILFIPPFYPLWCCCHPQTFLSFSSADQELKSVILLFVSLFVEFCVLCLRGAGFCLKGT